MFEASAIGRDRLVTRPSEVALEKEGLETLKRISDTVQIEPEYLQGLLKFVRSLKTIKSEGQIRIPPNKATLKRGSTTALELNGQIKRTKAGYHLSSEERERLHDEAEMQSRGTKRLKYERNRRRRRVELLTENKQNCNFLAGITSRILQAAPSFLFRNLRRRRWESYEFAQREIRMADAKYRDAERALRCWNQEISRKLQRAEEPSREVFPLDEMFKILISEHVPSTPKARLETIVTSNGKMRGITIHDELNSWSCINMTSLTIPFLKKQTESKRALTNKPVRIRRKDNGEKFYAYSVDYSKATDPISVETARAILFELSDHNEFPGWFRKSVDYFFRPHDILYKKGGQEYQKRVNCGCLMGQGPGWAVLSIINMFCGFIAAGRGTFQIMGDDLIGLFTAKEIDVFNRILVKVGLQINRTKTFISESYGVFCEKMVKITRRNGFCCLDEVTTDRISEYTAMKVDGAKGIGVLESVMKLRLSSATARARRRRVVDRMCKNTLPGPLRLGGGGVGRVNASTFKQFITRGATRGGKSLRVPGLKQVQELAQPFVGKGNDISEEEFVVKTRMLCHLNHLGICGVKSYDLSLTKKKYMCQFKKLPGSPLAILEKAMSEDNRYHLDFSRIKNVRNYIRRGNFHRACRELQRRETSYPAEVMSHIINKIEFKENLQLPSYKFASPYKSKGGLTPGEDERRT
jgi:hypothetical protein